MFVIGTPARTSNEGSVISGFVSAFRAEKQGSFIQSNVPVTHDNSGGPMFDDQGNVIGLTDLGDRDAAAINRFIPIADALSVRCPLLRAGSQVLWWRGHGPRPRTHNRSFPAPGRPPGRSARAV
ncbi:MAG: S1C family serine protease [Rhodospirillaceae bacterium]|nr:S1C family serine protease [Rhodospirillaceae bacterium]